MTCVLFFGWINQFNSFVGRKTGRGVIFLLDNCSAHGTARKVPPLPNTELLFLLPNTKSPIQTWDAGIIACLEALYKRRLNHHVIEKIKVGAADIYEVDILTAMQYISQSWKEASQATISHCWKHCFQDHSDSMQQKDIRSSIAESAQKFTDFPRINN